MKAVAVNGSPRKGGNTEILLRKYSNRCRAQVGTRNLFSLAERRSEDAPHVTGVSTRKTPGAA